MATIDVPNQVSFIEDAEALRKACKGWGTDEKAIISILGHRNATQRKQIRLAYEELYQEDLIKRLESELSGDFERAVYRWILDPADRDAVLANVAIRKTSPDHHVIVEISCTRSPEELLAVRRAYQARYKHSLEEDVAAHTKGDTRKLLVALVTAFRYDGEEINARLAKSEAKILHEAVKDKEFNHEEVIRILSTRSRVSLSPFLCFVVVHSLCFQTLAGMRPPRGRGGGGGFRGRGDGGRGRGRGGGRGGDRGDSAMKSRGGGRGGRGGGRGRGGKGGGMKGGSKVVVEPHRHEGVFVAKGKEDALVTKNMVPGEAVYNEKRIAVQNEDGTKVEYRVWNPFRSKLAAAVLGGVDNIWIKPGAKVLYLGAASGTTVSHVSDVVGPNGVVYAVEFSHRSGRDLVNMAKKRTNVIPIIEDARHPSKYRMLVGMVDVIFSDVAQPDQARILALNASHFLKAGGHFVISIKANCIDSTVPAEAVFQSEVKKLQQEQFKPFEQVTLEPFERDHACVVGGYRMPKKQKVAAA